MCRNSSFFRKLYGGVGLLIMPNVFSAVCAEDGYRNSQGSKITLDGQEVEH